MKTAEDYSEMINTCQYTRMYICDGEACTLNKDNCFKNDGACIHTSKEEHSIKKKLKDKFPPTRFVKGPKRVLFEEIDLAKFIQFYI